MKETKTPEMAKALDSLSLAFGAAQSRSSALRTQTCAWCGEDATEFTDDLSRIEFGISGMCLVCQDEIFVSSPEE